MIWLLMSLITALFILIHERNHNHPVEKWISEDYCLLLISMVFWPITLLAFLWVIIWPKLQCALGRHQFLVMEYMSYKDSKRVVCNNCRKEYLIIGSKPPILWSRRTDSIYG